MVFALLEVRTLRLGGHLAEQDLETERPRNRMAPETMHDFTIRVQPLLGEMLWREARIDLDQVSTRTHYDRHLAPRS